MPTATMPALIVEVAFADDPGDGTTWTDITSRVRAGSIRRGRTDERSEYQTGVLNLTLDNRDRALDPFNASSPYNGNLTPRKDIRVRATWNSVTYDLFYGQVAGWPVTPSVDGDTITQLEAYDALGQLADVQMPADAFTFAVRYYASYNDKLTVWLPLGGSDQVIQDVRGDSPKRNFTFTTTAPKTEGAPSSFLSGNATVFDGTYGAIGPVVPMVAGGTSGGMVTFWIKTTTAGPSGGHNPILATAGSSSIARIGVNQYGQLEVIYDTFNVNSGFVINDDNWHHVLIEHNTLMGLSAVPGIAIYVDGYLLNSDTSGTGTSIPGWQLLGMRNPYSTSDSEYFTGALAHVLCYDNNTNGTADTYSRNLNSAGAFGILKVTSNAPTANNVIGQVGNWSEVNWGTEDWDTGTVPIGALKWGGSALDVIQQATQAEYGRTFVSPTGVLNFHNRNHDFTATRSTTSQATYSDSGAAGTVGFSSINELVYSDEYLATEVGVTAGDGSTAVVQSANSTTYGYRSERFELPLSPPDALEWAVTYLSRYDHPTFRVNSWTVLPQTNAANGYPKVLDARLGDRVTLEIQPSKTGTRISEPLIVEQIAHSFTPERWETVFSGSPALDAWLLEDATYGLLEDTTILG